MSGGIGAAHNGALGAGREVRYADGELSVSASAGTSRRAIQPRYAQVDGHDSGVDSTDGEETALTQLHPPSHSAETSVVVEDRGARAVNTPSCLDRGDLPLGELAALGRREAHRPRPVYTAHRWFARRYGTAMRALLVAFATSTADDFWAAFNGDADLTGTSVADLFVGGGTILYEAHRLGATTFGADIDPVACAVTRFELGADQQADPTEILPDVIAAAAEQRALYRTVGPDGDDREAVHYFWVQQLACGACTETFDAHPNYLIASEKDRGNWLLCARCGAVHHRPSADTTLQCDCGHQTDINSGPLRRGVATCPACSHQETLIGYARRTGQTPQFRMFAVESVTAAPNRPKMVKIRDRIVHAATAADTGLYERAGEQLIAFQDRLPARRIPRVGRSDNRLTAYNYDRYIDLFNDRQQLHAARLLDVVAALPAEHHDAYALALSNHLLSSNMLTRYTPTYRQVTPLFTLRAYVHSPRPVELNPWLTSIGRGTYPNAVRKTARAIAFAANPVEYTPTGFAPTPNRVPASSFDVRNTDSASLPHIPDGSVELVVTDPPYLDNIDYSELADFFVPWLAATGLIDDSGAPPAGSLAAKGRTNDHGDTFASGLTACFREGARILSPNGRFAFTFQHSSDVAWSAVASAIRGAALRVVTVFPLSGDSDVSMHRHAGSSTWDAVFVLRHAAEDDADHAATSKQLDDYVDGWAAKLPLRGPDVANLRRAVAVAARCGFLPPHPLAGDAMFKNDPVTP